MNSTKWYTLTEFVQHLSKTGQVRADQTDKGWFISVIQPDPEEKLAEEKRHKRDRAERVRSCLTSCTDAVSSTPCTGSPYHLCTVPSGDSYALVLAAVYRCAPVVLVLSPVPGPEPALRLLHQVGFLEVVLLNTGVDTKTWYPGRLSQLCAGL